MVVGAQLRRLREARGISREQAGYEIRSSESKISRMELGRVSFRLRDVADLLTLYGVAEDDPERERLLGLVREANAPGWWHQFGDLMPSWFQPYVGLESAASVIRTYECQAIPGLLQTRDYARAVVKALAPGATAAEVERRVELRATRQHQVLHRNPAPVLWAVIDEAALHRPIGGVAVLRDQLTALVEAAREPNIKIQLLPFEVGGHAGLTGSFTILRFPEQDLSDVIYVELLTSGLFLDRSHDVDTYAEAMERLCLQAREPDQTAGIIESILKELG
ncbi:MAG: helix-turn-helix domain-containing protein [Micromonosporaceae bacterium]|nr:helix-turn-helix domain-containing protein [Micromonosporaceae bacterium]